MRDASTGGHVDPDPVLSNLIEIIRPHAKEYRGEFGADTKIEAIGIDSFDFVEIIFEIEEKYGIEIDYNANSTFSRLTTIGDFAGEISKLVAAKSPA